MTRKSPQQPDSVIKSIGGQRPALDPDADTVAIPRPADELTGGDENDTSKTGDLKDKRER